MTEPDKIEVEASSSGDPKNTSCGCHRAAPTVRWSGAYAEPVSGHTGKSHFLYHVRNVRGIVVVVAKDSSSDDVQDLVEPVGLSAFIGVPLTAIRPGQLAQIRELVRGVLTLGEQTADEVSGYLTLVSDRDRHVEELAGRPQLVETESLRQTYAGLFHRRMFETVPMLNAASIAELLGPVNDVRGYTKRLRDSSTVIALKRGNAYLYPAFQFDADRHKVRPTVSDVNEALGAAGDPWGALAWWTTPNPRWEHRVPIDHPDDQRLLTLVSAQAEDGF